MRQLEPPAEHGLLHHYLIRHNDVKMLADTAFYNDHHDKSVHSRCSKGRSLT